jgi:hypothetical protein
MADSLTEPARHHNAEVPYVAFVNNEGTGIQIARKWVSARALTFISGSWKSQ